MIQINLFNYDNLKLIINFLKIIFKKISKKYYPKVINNLLIDKL